MVTFAFALFLNNNNCGYTGADVVENRIVNAIYNYGTSSELRNTSLGM